MNTNDFKQYDELTNLDKVEALKAANDELLQLKYEQTIAGLFAALNLIKYKSGNVAVQVFSGISVGNRLKSYALNSIKLFKDTGDVLFDYGDDNATKKLNLKKEVLKRNN